MKRLQEQDIQDDLNEKMVFLSGPRQVGKTTLARACAAAWPSMTYLNFDADRDRRVILQETWDRESPLVIFDEVHKLKQWKRKLKGIYDTEGIPPRILVTGSARLTLYRRGGESLAGRYLLHRLYPFSVRELRGTAPPAELLENLLRFGGFPEPFLAQSEKRAARWRKQHLERIVREDVQDLEPVRDIQTMLLLIDLLRARVGSPISMASLARDLELSPHTVKKWIHTLEHMFVCFVVTPYHRNIARAILKEPKIYFFDTGAVLGDDGARLENTVAVSLLKHLHYLEDSAGKDVRLCYLRDKEGREVDFMTMVDRRIESLVEVKTGDTRCAKSLKYYHERLQPRQSIQLVRKLSRTLSEQGIAIRPAADWLDTLSI
ncbi:MAG: ATP-binding protein [Deltaproteobacteria bacterium]|nr:ATP-binding protein [Deltaproteobacteria bacterium]